MIEKENQMSTRSAAQFNAPPKDKSNNEQSKVQAPQITLPKGGGAN